VQVSPTGHTLIASYSGHTDAVDAVAASPDGRVLATGGWDGALLLWRTGQAVVEAAAESVRSGEAAAAAAPAKKRKGSTQGGPAGDEEALAPEGGLKEEAQARFEGHVHCVASLGFATASTLFSGGWDHSVSTGMCHPAPSTYAEVLLHAVDHDEDVQLCHLPYTCLLCTGTALGRLNRHQHRHLQWQQGRVLNSLPT
jgi:WD40 repeat protein